MKLTSNFRITAVAAAALVFLGACSSESALEIRKGSPMGFRVWMETGTRGVETTTASLTDIWVSAFPASGASFFDEEKFSCPAGNSGSLSSPPPPTITGRSITRSSTSMRGRPRNHSSAAR